MKCSHVLVNGQHVILSGSTKYYPCIKCREIADRQCDWKLGRDRTCDKWICSKCTVSPVPNKDLCPTHASNWANHPSNRAAKAAGSPA